MSASTEPPADAELRCEVCGDAEFEDTCEDCGAQVCLECGWACPDCEVFRCQGCHGSISVCTKCQQEEAS